MKLTDKTIKDLVLEAIKEYDAENLIADMYPVHKNVAGKFLGLSSSKDIVETFGDGITATMFKAASKLHPESSGTLTIQDYKVYKADPNAVDVDAKKFFEKATKINFEAKLAELNDPNVGVENGIEIPGVPKHLKRSNPSDLEPTNKFSIDLPLPDDSASRKAILRTFNDLLGDDAIDDLAKISENLIMEDQNKLDWQDFSVILQDPSHPLFRKALLALRQMKNTDPDADITKGISQMASTVRGDYGYESDANVPVEYIPNVDIADMHGATRQDVPQYIMDIFNGLDMFSIPSVKGRVEKLNKFSKMIREGASEEELKSYSIGEIFSTLGILNGLSKIAKKMDNKAAGWAFESFLAQLFNGTTEGTAMGAADFLFGLSEGDVIPPGTKGSAKFINSLTFTQAWSTTSEVLRNNGDKIVYVVGHKAVSADGGRDTSSLGFRGARQEEFSNIDVVTLYLLTLSNVNGSIVADKGTVSGGGGENKDIPLESGDMRVTIDSNAMLQSIYLSKDYEDLNNWAGEALSKVQTEIPTLIQNLEMFTKKTKSYLSAGREESLSSAVNSYVALFDLINQVFGVDSQVSKETGVSTGVEVDGNNIRAKTNTMAEQKITANFLKKLIEESFKK